MTDDQRDAHDADLRALWLLDPAHEPRPQAGQGAAAQKLLTQVLSRPSGAGPDEPGHGTHRPLGRWLLSATAAAAVVAAVVVAPPWGAPEHAFATWTPVPEQVSATVEVEIAEECSNELAMDVLDQRVVVAEERGRVTFGLLSRAGYLSHCLLVDGAWVLSGGGATGSYGSEAQLADDEVQTVLAAAGGNEDTAYTTITGRVGEDVVAVEVHPRGPVEEPGALPGGSLPETVVASVENGYYAAWWPGVSVEAIELTIHLADGTVLPDVPAIGP
ncbi:MAG TPA: hypothetical protein VK053_07050 [Jiangellaceae bacterium]|nr:hypothetical protein [Jiangellaceae bacterium]